MIFLSFFILAYKVIINSTNIDNLVADSTRIPAFVLIYSPYCPHCTKVHPDWLKLMDIYENDTKVITAECNAISDGASCRKIYDYKGFPSFIAFTRRRGVWLRNLNRTLPSFINETERLKTTDLSFPCPLFKTDFTNEYPAITINRGNSKTDSCSSLQRIEKLVPDLTSFLYVGEENESKIVAKLTANNNVVYQGDDSEQSKVDFIKEYAFKQFENHNSQIKYTSYHRKIILFIYNQPGPLRKIQSYSEEYYKDFIFMSYYYRSFNKTFPKIQVTPLTAIVSNDDKTKFAIFNNISSDANSTKNFLEKMKNNDYVADTILTMLFPQQQRNQRINIVNRPEKAINKNPEKTINKNPDLKEKNKKSENSEKHNVQQRIEIIGGKKENNEAPPPPRNAEIEKNVIREIEKEEKSKFVPIFLFVVGLLVMIAIGVFAYFKIKDKNIAKIE